MKTNPITYSLKKLVLLHALLVSSLLIKGQEKKPEIGLIASAQPLFLFTNALKADVEIKSKSKFLNAVVSPELYFGYTSDKSENKNLKSDELTGYGIGGFHKIDFKGKKYTPYFSYGVMYRNLTVSYDDEGFVPQIKNGLEYYEYGAYTDQLKINSVLVSSCFGVQSNDFGSVILDLYFGIGYKTSSKKSTYPYTRKYDQGQLSFAYNGIIPMFGLKAGYKIK